MSICHVSGMMTCECFGFIISNIAVRSERNHIGTVAVVESNCVYMCALTFLASLARVARLSLIKEHFLIFFRSGRIVGHCRTYRRKEKILPIVCHRIHGAAIYGNMDPINIPPLC